MKNILCFGDSNTWGYIPGTAERYSENIRWPCVLQRELGDEYLVHEDGLNGRTTSYDLAWSPYRNGMAALPYSLLSQKPLDLLIISLGINDLAIVSPEYSARSAQGLIKTTAMLQACRDTILCPIFPNGIKILYIIPAPVDPGYDEMYGTCSPSIYQESLKLKDLYSRMADNMDINWLDAGEYARASKVDCLHYDAESHSRLGKAIAKRVHEILDS